MTHKNAPAALVHVVRRVGYVNGPKIERHDISIGSVLPWRISKRMNAAHRIGLEFVRGIGHEASSNVIGVYVSDGTRTLAAWRAMEGLTGFTGTGTHDAHTLVPRGVIWTGKGWN